MKSLVVLSAIVLVPMSAQAQQLDLLGVCPGTLNISVSGITPNGRYAILTSSDSGNAIVPGGPCTGAQLGLSDVDLKYRTSKTADGSGAGSLAPNLPGGVCGLAIQVLDLTTCLPSNYDFIPTPVITTTITDVQMGAHAEYDVVNVSGVVTATDANGVWLQEAGPSEPYGGLYVFLGSGYDVEWFPIVRGDVLQVQGEYREYFDLTEIHVPASPSRNVVDLGNTTVPSPAVVTLNELATNGELWEGVLVRVNNTTVASTPNGFGEWTVTNGTHTQQVDDVMYDAGTGRNIGDPVAFVQGVLGYAFSAYEILPRDANDVSP